MKKVVLLFLLVVVIGVCFYISKQSKSAPVIDDNREATTANVLDLAFVVDGEEYRLDNGLATKSLTPESSFLMTLKVFGQPVYSDLDRDGDEDVAIWLEYQPGGSGTFYYGALAMKEGEGYKATDTLFLGDRITPLPLRIEDGRVVYDFVERRADEPFSTPPSIPRSVYVHYDVASGEIGEWVKDFEGESNPTEVYKAQVDRVSVIFENYNYSLYRLVANGQMQEGGLNTEKGYKDDSEATVYILDWQKSLGEQKRYVRMAGEPEKIYLLDSAGEIVRGSVLYKD